MVYWVIGVRSGPCSPLAGWWGWQGYWYWVYTTRRVFLIAGVAGTTFACAIVAPF